MTLAEAITAAESASVALTNADNAQIQAQLKYDAALSAKNEADRGESDATTAYNASLDNLIAAAAAAKRISPLDKLIAEATHIPPTPVG